MQNLGGYSQQLNFLDGAALGQSPLLPETCVGAISGPSNPDGQCIRGGRLTKAGGCEATPIYAVTMVPYTSGTVAGPMYDVLNNLRSYTKVNQAALMTHLQRGATTSMRHGQVY